MPDLFDFFRLALGWVATIYATVVTVQSAWSWWVWLAGSDRMVGLVRRYLLVHGLRLRVRAFGGDVLVCLLLTVAFLLLWHAHGLVEQLAVALDRLREPAAAVRRRG